MKVLASVIITASLASTTLADNTLMFTSFGLPGCVDQQLEQVTLSDTQCQVISSGGFSFFTTTNIQTDPGCNLVFSNQPDCSTVDGEVIVPNDQQCFEAGANGDIIHANLFCN